MKKWITPLFALFPIIAFSQDAQEPDSMYVVTECFLNDGYSLQAVSYTHLRAHET